MNRSIGIQKSEFVFFIVFWSILKFNGLVISWMCSLFFLIEERQTASRSSATHAKDKTRKNNAQRNRENDEINKENENDWIQSGTHAEKLLLLLLLPLIKIIIIRADELHYAEQCSKRVGLTCSMNAYTINSSRYLNFKSIACNINRCNYN